MAFFPICFPDELYISILNRRYQLSGDAPIIGQSLGTPGNPKFKNWVYKNNGIFQRLETQTPDLSMSEFWWNHSHLPILQLIGNGPIRGHIREDYLGKMCPNCIIEDLGVYGVAYVHRSHNYFQVDFCHIHNVKLEILCQCCGLQHKNHTADMYYVCANNINPSCKSLNPESTESRYAAFVHGLLTHQKQETSREIRGQGHQARVLDLGLDRTDTADRKKVTDFVITKLANSTIAVPETSDQLLLIGTGPQKWTLFNFALYDTAQNYLEYLRRGQERIARRKRSKHQRSYELWNDSFLFQTLCKHYEKQLGHNQWEVDFSAMHNLTDNKTSQHSRSISLKLSSELCSVFSVKSRPSRLGYAKIKMVVKDISKVIDNYYYETAVKGSPESYDHYYARTIIWSIKQLEDNSLSISSLSERSGLHKLIILRILTGLGWIKNGVLIKRSGFPSDISMLNLAFNWSAPTINS